MMLEEKMEIVIAIICLVVTLIVLRLVFNIALDKVKQLGKNERLNRLTDAFPENIEVCKKILAMLGNKDVKIEENKDSETSLYLVMTNKISIANLKGNYTRIQTVAHECIHSMQDKRILWFNFVFSNLYLIYFVIAIILTIFGILKNPMLQIFILTLLGFIYYIIRSYLETDAVIKARYLARIYMKSEKLIKPEEIEEICGQYDLLNKLGVQIINYNLVFSVLVKVIAYSVIAIII